MCGTIIHMQELCSSQDVDRQAQQHSTGSSEQAEEEVAITLPGCIGLHQAAVVTGCLCSVQPESRHRHCMCSGRMTAWWPDWTGQHTCKVLHMRISTMVYRSAPCSKTPGQPELPVQAFAGGSGPATRPARTAAEYESGLPGTWGAGTRAGQACGMPEGFRVQGQGADRPMRQRRCPVLQLGLSGKFEVIVYSPNAAAQC